MFGSIDDLLDELPSKQEEEYPLLFVPYFTRQSKENEAEFKYDILSFMITLYKPYGKDEGKSTKNSILTELEPIINELIGKLHFDMEEEVFPIRQAIDFKGNGPNISEPIAPNDLIGWAYEFDIMIQSSIQHNPDSWQ
ncbi:hypothetical protein [Chondrinema litorale]|uniref:hypothetical protein n=1 Tax=Chondrinema litorale TaxID=2994555 RepID=UPI0025433512|nr:hypothetical protein [Chondrinema litorale]UZR93130.1 hypothetical protein OQ292_14820 [Chondrinema litorale]